MKKILIIYNVIFLLAGNVLFSNIHAMHHHNHYHENEIIDCVECIIVDNNTNYISDFQDLNFSKKYITEFRFQYSIIVKSSYYSSHNSRAPPIPQ